MGKALVELAAKQSQIPISASTPDLTKSNKALQRRYTFSVLDCDPLSPKTPALVAGDWKYPDVKENRDPVVSVPSMLDNSFIMIQSRMDPIQAALRQDPDAFDPIEHRMEFDMLNSVFKTIQNIAYHLNKLVRSLSKNDEKASRPVDGVDGLDLVSGVRAAISRSQEGCKRLAQLVKNHKKMFGHETTKDVLGEDGLVMLEQIESAMGMTLAKSAKLVDALAQAKKNKAKAVMQKAAAALLQIQSDKGDKTVALKMHFHAWRDAIATIKEERAAESA
jgi:hypothetical protein